MNKKNNYKYSDLIDCANVSLFEALRSLQEIKDSRVQFPISYFLEIMAGCNKEWGYLK